MTDLTLKDLKFAHETSAVDLLREGVLAVLATLATWQRRQRDRAALAQLSVRDLKDIGLSDSQAVFEAGKPFWRA
ncbi:MAG: DUF1127 domain-containing protein [Alphaproteobacteria bacterium]|nr:DUF1127 domain-containing protein [Alphaproteobacteria bacterium]